MEAPLLKYKEEIEVRMNSLPGQEKYKIFILIWLWIDTNK